MIIPVILAGGMGSRLWPLSREQYPKQFLTLVGENSLFQETLKRVQGLSGSQDPIVICNKQYRFLIAEQMLEMNIEEPKLVLETAGRNTAPAIAIAAFIAKEMISQHENPLLLILPADHLIQEHERFRDSIQQAAHLATNNLLTFGIRPHFAETGYGYIQLGAPLQNNIYKVAEFIEKPPREKAEAFLKAGNYYWNSGMFLFSASTYLAELKLYRPDIFEACLHEFRKIHHANGFYTLSENFKECPSESIDYAVMEKTDKALVLPLDISWNDIGSWTALQEILPHDSNNNILQGDITCINTKNCLIRAESRLVATAGLKDHIVIETKDAVMVAHKDYAQKVKELVAELKIAHRSEAEYPAIVNRSWGTYEVLIATSHFKIKMVHIKPLGELRLQKHFHRSEHWIIIDGQATVILNGVTQNLKKSESTFISPGETHQLKNPDHDIILQILEVQVGNLLLEEDTETLD